jgi:23S rRNA (guanosine2251-2'-O)-methyltransferase
MDEFICGRNSVREALRSGRKIKRVLIGDFVAEGFYREIEDLCRLCGVSWQKADKKTLISLSGRDNQGIAAQAAPLPYTDINAILKRAADKGETPFMLMLANIEDTGNFGAIIRTAHCAGAHGIIVPRRRTAPLNHTVFKAAQGAAEYMPIVRTPNLNAAAAVLKEKGLWLIAGEASGVNYWQIDFSLPLCLVLGGEGKGIQPLLLKACDFKAAIPLLGVINSLNVSAAAAVLCYETVRRRESLET